MTSANVVVTNLRKNATKKIRKLTLDIAANLIEDTPVDTGWARANWIPTIGERRTEPAPEESALGEQQAGIAAMALWKFGDGDIVVSNNVPYIERLDGGHSQQAPRGFVRAAIDRAVHDNS